MAIRTVRLDEETEMALQELRKTTGMPISEALKRGIRALRDQVQREAGQHPYDVYAGLDLGAGGSAVAPSTDVARGVRRALKKKLGR